MENSIRKLSSLLLGAGAAVAITGSVQAQETQTRDTSRTSDTTAAQQAQADTATQDTTQWGYQTDTTAVRNPPGYRGMERDTTMVPPAATGDDVPAPQVGDRTTGVYDRPEWQDTTAEVQNPAGYRGMERPVGTDSAAKGTGGADPATQEEIDRYTQRLGDLGYKVEKMSKAEKKAWSKKSGKTDKSHKKSDKTGKSDQTDKQNPPGYRGMERPAGIPADTAKDPSAGMVEDKATGTYDDKAWRDSTSAEQNPAGYRGMERPVGSDTAASETTTPGDTVSDRPAQAEPRMDEERSDTASTVGQGEDTSADTTRFDENAEEGLDKTSP